MENQNQTRQATEDTIVRPGQSGGGQSLQRVGFGTTELQRQRETQGSAIAARAQAEVQARYIMAMQRPRNIEDVRVRLKMHCQRTGFALVAEYSKPVGGNKIKGPSIRFVETALQEYGNVLPDATVIYDDDEKRIIRVSVTDLERNVTYNDEAVVEKFVERRNPKDGDEVIGSRQNSYGTTVYRIRATEDDFANKCAAAVSKKTRNLGLRILPADLVDEAMWQCSETRKNATYQDPASAKRYVIDRFTEIGVRPTDLEQYLGHPMDQVSPAELDELRAAYATVKDGEAKWMDLVEVQLAQRGELEKTSKAGEAAGSKLKAKIAEVKEKRANAQPPANGSGQAAPPAAPAAQTAPAASAPAKSEKKTTANKAKPEDPKPAEPAPVAAPNVELTVPVGEAPPLLSTPKEGYEDRTCNKCGVPIEVPKTDPPGAVCYSCSQA